MVAMGLQRKIMKRLSPLVVLVLLSLTAWAVDLRYNGVRPDVLIDVRTPAEFSAGHIDGAINIPVERISQAIRQVKGLQQDSLILVYCRSGRRSAAAMSMLEQQGFRRVLDGGSMEMLARSLKYCTSATC